MLEDRYSFSKTASRVFAAFALSLSLAACSASTGKKSELGLSYAAPEPAAKQAQKAASDEIRKRVSQLDFGKTGSVAKTTVSQNANCRYLTHSADAEAAIIASPTLEATSDDEGAGSVSLTMNLFDLNKAQLVRASAEAKCEYHLATKKIEATLGQAGKSTLVARNTAKHKYLKSQVSHMEQIGRSAREKMQNGTITRQDANSVRATIDQLKAEMQLAKAEANKASDLPPLDMELIRNANTDLMLAGRKLQQVEREIRTNDALELSIGGGYRYNETSTGINSASREDDAFAKVTLGVRLGMFSHRRTQAEEAAAHAHTDALFEQQSGAIWKSEAALRSIDRLILDLKRTELEIARALAKAGDTIAALAGNQAPDSAKVLMKAQLQKISIAARLAETRAAIGQLKENRQRIAGLTTTKQL